VALDLYAIQDRLEHWERLGPLSYFEDVAALIEEVVRLRTALEEIAAHDRPGPQQWLAREALIR
jgi:hypothetical protein